MYIKIYIYTWHKEYYALQIFPFRTAAVPPSLSSLSFTVHRVAALAQPHRFPRRQTEEPQLRVTAPRTERKTAITGQRGEKLNTGKLLCRVSGGLGEMTRSFLPFILFYLDFFFLLKSISSWQPALKVAVCALKCLPLVPLFSPPS